MTIKDEYKSAMVVVAHADDAEFGCSGTVAKWCSEGIKVVYVLCTDGSKGSEDKSITSSELVKIRQDEQIVAGKILGLHNVVFLGYPDAYLEPTLDLRRDIAREIRKYKPDILITTYPTRNLNGSIRVGHPDHIAAGEASLAAVFPTARDHLTFPELLKDGLKPHKVKEVLIMGHPNPDKWIDVTLHIETSIKALMAHESQIQWREDEVSQRMRQWREEAAHGHEIKYAEAFKHIHIPD